MDNEYAKRLKEIQELPIKAEEKFTLQIFANVENYEKETGEKVTYELIKRGLLENAIRK